MAVFGGDAMRRMRLNREGKWEIQSAAKGEPDANAAAQATNAGTRKPDSSMICPYCRTALEESHKIDNTLYRCPNPECRRLTYLT
jgi:hypothetical protein